MPKRLPTPHDNDAGLLGVSKNPLTGKFVCTYLAAEQGLDTDAGKYTCICWGHDGGTTISHTNKTTALWLMRNPTEWCEGCVEEDAAIKRLGQEILASAL